MSALQHFLHEHNCCLLKGYGLASNHPLSEQSTQLHDVRISMTFITKSVNVNRSTKTLSLLFNSAVESILTNKENFLKFPVFLVISSRSGNNVRTLLHAVSGMNWLMDVRNDHAWEFLNILFSDCIRYHETIMSIAGSDHPRDGVQVRKKVEDCAILFKLEYFINSEST